MRAKGISYETGFLRAGRYSRVDFEPRTVASELRVIRDDLHCDAVRIIGGDPERLEFAAACAAELGLEIWFSPYPLDSTVDEMLALFADCAERAERIRRRGAEVVFVTGAELSLMNPGFLPGDTLDERVRSLTAGPDDLPEQVAEAGSRVNDFLGKAVSLVRERFGGRVTYASIPLERVDWTPFDIVSVDLYRTAEVAERFGAGVRALVAQGKPLAVTEFGASTFQGAGDVGARGLEIVEYDQTHGPVRLDGAYARDEGGQAAYLRELLEVFDAEGVDSAFVFVLALYDHVHRPGGDPRDDLDLASYSIVKVLEGRHGDTYPDLPWEPKAAFGAVADYYGNH
ncbi:hypothetical protein [Nocardia asiatica]|uniref:hypothetical protein n=1 Tax=Nocardia asiatica TaxID=209252 RepID=UPI00245458C1|nr:hypothetical protein [Nocardia asiatica]